jgi:hypothetical protein
MLGSAVTVLHKHANNVTNINQSIKEVIFVCGISCYYITKREVKGKAVRAVTGLEWPKRFQEVKVSRFHENGTGWW